MFEEMFDEGLKEIMGDRYDDGDTPSGMPVLERKAKPEPKADQPTYRSEESVLFGKLWRMTKWLGICGGISMLMWWFEANGLMAMEAAYPCILGCAVIGGFGVGRSTK